MYIYKATNKINNKCYIGKTICSFEKRKQEHIRESKYNRKNSHFYNAIRKYGKKVFIWEVLEEHDDEDVLMEREIYYISFYKSNNRKYGYNKTDGGEGLSGWKQSEHCKKNMKKNNPMFNPETVKKVKETKKLNGTLFLKTWDERYSEERVSELKNMHSEIMKKNNPMFNPETVKKVQRTKKMKYYKSEKYKKDIENRSKLLLGKSWIIIDPDGNEYEIKNLHRFCKENNLHSSCMIMVADGKRLQHKKYKCKRGVKIYE